MLVVEKKERHIKRGMEFQFPWQNEICELKVCHYILQSAVKDYLTYLKMNGDKEATVERAKFCLKNASRALGNDFIISNLNCLRAKRAEKKWEIGIVLIGDCDQNLHNTISI